MLKKLSKVLILLVFLVFISLSTYQIYIKSSNKQPKYLNYRTEHLIVVDMGSTGTRMHAYNVKKLATLPNNAIPQIEEIALAKSKDKKNIAKYCNNPKNVAKHIQPLYLKLQKQLQEQNLDINTIPIYYLATAGMRLQDSEQQKQVYEELTKNIKLLGHDDNIVAKTIPGEQEGIFDWLSVNYKLKTIQNKKPTIAALDMGGASTQVAIEYKYKPKTSNDYNVKNDLYNINFSNYKYTVYSKSILGYGLTQTKEKINYDEQTSDQCNIPNNILDAEQKDHYNKYHHQIGFDVNKNYKKTTKEKSSSDTSTGISKNKKFNLSDFNFKNCSNHIKKYLEHKKEHVEIAKVVNNAIKENMQFLAFSGYYYNFKFFNSQKPEDLLKAIPDTCHSHRKQFKKQFPHISEKELNETCFDATYLKILLNNGYKIPENYEHFVIPKHDIDWTIGAALFITTEQKWIE